MAFEIKYIVSFVYETQKHPLQQSTALYRRTTATGANNTGQRLAEETGLVPGGLIEAEETGLVPGGQDELDGTGLPGSLVEAAVGMKIIPTIAIRMSIFFEPYYIQE